MFPRLALALLAIGICTSAARGQVTAPVDPLTVADDDFARHRDPAEWRGLRVTRMEFTEERAAWRLWRIADPARPRGPLWFVPHDDENAAFDAALAGLRKYGGVLIAVDSGIAPESDGRRRNAAVTRGRTIDPNRNFDGAIPLFAESVLGEYRRGARPIVALHTNSPGFDTARSRCNRDDPPGEGRISIRYCDPVMQPVPSPAALWPFDDPDTLAIVAHRHAAARWSGYCGKALEQAGFNLVFERVLTSDGSLSNHALLRGLDYVNFETRDLGLDPAGLAEASGRLTAMIDRALPLCQHR
ncbi:hypothetical protein ACFQ1E_16965 [Sphingomonas canadensis]|uniref:DUF4350 domain-containing protein n=1 Tax=Sphingomonas canadensis TaxID=1219257 RepID=A0ABW3HET7_9SPHN|nr:hypothetical protein [Sphingomonas canadensis]MCW3837738.1 hypothetical protein [Sphingomonas canadensis]